MPVRASATRSTSRRRTVVVASKASRDGRPVAVHRAADHAPRPVLVEVKAHSGPSPYMKAMRFLASLSDYERMRIVRYTSQNFDLDRMRTLLRKL